MTRLNLFNRGRRRWGQPPPSCRPRDLRPAAKGAVPERDPGRGLPRSGQRQSQRPAWQVSSWAIPADINAAHARIRVHMLCCAGARGHLQLRARPSSSSAAARMLSLSGSNAQVMTLPYSAETYWTLNIWGSSCGFSPGRAAVIRLQARRE